MPAVGIKPALCRLRTIVVRAKPQSPRALGSANGSFSLAQTHLLHTYT
jgi:hypothetical protein